MERMDSMRKPMITIFSVCLVLLASSPVWSGGPEMANMPNMEGQEMKMEQSWEGRRIGACD